MTEAIRVFTLLVAAVFPALLSFLISTFVLVLFVYRRGGYRGAYVVTCVELVDAYVTPFFGGCGDVCWCGVLVFVDDGAG